MPELFCYKYIPNLSIVSSDFFGEKTRWKFGKVDVILSVIPTAFLFCWTVVYGFAKTKNNPYKNPLKSLQSMEHDHLSHQELLCIERAYVDRVDIEKVVDEFLSRKGRFSFSTQLIYFKSWKKK